MSQQTPQSTLETVRKPIRGISLFSGGLDSQLAVCILRDQGIEMEALVFDSPFFNIAAAITASKALKIKLNIVDFTDDVLGLLNYARHGFGGAMNPCIDCHALMIKRAGEFMREHGFDFVSTGEVLNQRPMSQNKRALGEVEKDSGLAGYLVRPLSALLLEPTLLEQDGRIDRSQLCDLQGRNRKPQFELASRFGIEQYPTPAGGCLLTEKGFCAKLRDLMDHHQCTCGADATMLKLGRHFRLHNQTKCVVGRNRTDNQQLKALRKAGDVTVYTVDVPGPTAHLIAPVAQNDILLAAGIVAGYGDKGTKTEVIVKVITDQGPSEITVTPLDRETYVKWML